MCAGKQRNPLLGHQHIYLSTSPYISVAYAGRGNWYLGFSFAPKTGLG